MTILLFITGLILLILGAEALVRGASRIAARMGVSPLVIGLTVVAFGTSSPELAVGIKSTVAGQGNIAVGNVIGSNIFNVLLILGASALILPLRVSQQLVRLDVPLMIGLSALVLLFVQDQNLGRVDGLVLVTALVVYLSFLFYQGVRNNGNATDDFSDGSGSVNRLSDGWLINIALVTGGLAVLVLGSRWLVDSAVAFAQYLGISELVIGLTVVAAGTSLPEAVTSVVAALRGERDIAVGNVVGSNIFNILVVLGITGIIAPGGIDVAIPVVLFDIPIMIVVAFACLPIFFTGGIISRWEGALLLGYYFAYTLYLILDASGHDALTTFSHLLLYYAIPLTAITLVVILVQEIRSRKK